MRTERHILSCCVAGTTRELVSLHYGQAGSGRKALIQASLHADEPPGLLVAYHLRHALAQLEADGLVLGEIVLVPMANPIGSAQRLLGRALGRFELASGENFNRHYADLSAAAFALLKPIIDGGELPSIAQVRAALSSAAAQLPVHSELQSLRRILLQLAIDADWVLDLHCDNEAVLHLYTATPVWPTVEPLARLLGSHIALLAVESGGEPFDEACSMVWARLARHYRDYTGKEQAWPDACVAVTIELRGETDVSHAHAKRDAQAILAWLSHQGLLDTPRPALPALLNPPRPLQGSVPVVTPRGGVLVHRDLLGQMVRQGQCIAEVIDPISGEAVELVSAVDGLLYARESVRIVHAGMPIAKVAGTEAIRSGSLLSA